MNGSRHYDVTIVGGGVIGAAVAYFLSVEAKFDGSIAIVERDLSYADATTARSVGGLRQQFSTPENIRMSLFGLEFIRGIKARFGAGADVAFRENGYLLLASREGLPVLESNHEIQRAHGADIAFLDPAELRKRFSWLSTDGIAAGAYGCTGEGWLDPVSLAGLMRNAAREHGVDVIHADVTGLEHAGGRIRALRLADGQRLGCGILVNAAGPWAGRLAAMAGLALPVEPRKRFVYVFDCRQPPQGAPLTVDPSGVYFRPESNQFICGCSPPADREPPPDDLTDIDYSWFEEKIWPALAHRVSAFEAIKMTGAWAGFYDYNTLDQNAIIGPHPGLKNFYFVNGFSGHGLQQAPAAGRAIAELIMHGRFMTIDLARFAYDRIASGEPLLEANVI